MQVKPRVKIHKLYRNAMGHMHSQLAAANAEENDIIIAATNSVQLVYILNRY